MAGFGVLWRVLGMPEYEYEALDSSDNSVAGKIESSSANDALKSLISDGLRVTQISGLDDHEDLDANLLTEKPQTVGDKILDIFGWLLNCVGFPLAFFSMLKSYDNPKTIIAVALLTIAVSGFGVYRRLVYGTWPGVGGD